jgi:hypothetical protein
VLLRERRHRRELLRERVGQDANRAVGKLDRPAAASDRLEEGRQFGRDPAEVDGSGELEPVDAAGDVPGDAPRGAVAAARDLHQPAGGGELRASRRHAGKKSELCERGRWVGFSLSDYLDV